MSGNTKIRAISGVLVCPEYTKGTPLIDQTTTALGTTTTAIVAGIAAEDGLFKGLHAYFYSGANAGRLVKITDFDNGTGTFTFTPVDGGSALGAVASGEKFLVGSIMPASNASANVNVPPIERDDWETDTLDHPSMLAGNKECSVSFDVEVGGLETPAGNGTAAGVDQITRLLELIGSFSSRTGTTINGTWGSTTTGDVTSAAGLSAGEPIMQNGEVSIIQSISTNTLVVSPPFSAAPVDTTVVYAAETHTPADTGHRSFTVVCKKDDQIYQLKGVVLNCKFGATFNQLVKFSVDGQGGSWDVYDSGDANALSNMDGIMPSNAACRMISARVIAGSTELFCNQVDFDFGHNINTIEDSDKNKERHIDDRVCSVSVTFRNVDKVALETWEANKTKVELMLQLGNAAGDCVVVTGQFQFESVEGAEYGGVWAYKANLKAYDDRGSLTPTKPLLSRF